MSHSIQRRTALLTLGGSFIASKFAVADPGYPTKPVSLISGYAAGGPVDIFGRLAANHLSGFLNVPFVVETRAGASGMIAGDHVARSAPDGYQLLVTVPSLFTMLPFMNENIRVRSSDFTPIGQIAEAPLVLLCNPDLPARNAKDLFKLLRKGPSLAFASAGPGTLPHLTAELLLSRIAASAQHVPYKGSAPALQDLIGGQIHFSTDNIAPALPAIKAGRLRALAVTSSKRYAGLPDVPTLQESGVDDFNVTNWFGIFAPAGTAQPVVGRLADAMARMTHDPAFIERVHTLGGVPVDQTPAQTAARIATESAQWGPLIRKLGLKA
ncbi:MAG: tripartite tricarboxylate transporter substrate binding protein [Burkholderiaceae bacterium]